MMAYFNKTINNGPYGSFVADPGQSDIGIYLRCKLAAPSVANLDGKPCLFVAGVAERTNVVPMQPIAAGTSGTVKFVGPGVGEQFGIMTGTCVSGDTLYTQAGGKVGTSSTGGALLCGIATSPGSDGNVVTYLPITAAA